MIEVTITGADQFRRAGEKLRAAGRRDLELELRRALGQSLDDAEAAWKKALPSYLPDPYAAAVAATVTIKRQRLSGKWPLIRLRASATTARGKERELVKVDAGKLRHPLAGDRRFWFDQAVKPGMWSEELRQTLRPMVRRDLTAAVRRVLAKLGAK